MPALRFRPMRTSAITAATTAVRGLVGYVAVVGGAEEVVAIP